MKEPHYKALVLPPDHWHISMSDTFSKLNQYMPSMINVLIELGYKKSEIYIKYRSEKQKNNFPPSDHEYVFKPGYGTLKNYLKKDVIVIGPPNSATIECLLNDIKYFTFEYLESFYANGATDFKSLDLMRDIIFVANNTKELKNNIKNNNLFKDNKNKDDLIYSDSINISDIVNKILNSS